MQKRKVGQVELAIGDVKNKNKEKKLNITAIGKGVNKIKAKIDWNIITCCLNDKKN